MRNAVAQGAAGDRTSCSASARGRAAVGFSADAGVGGGACAAGGRHFGGACKWTQSRLRVRSVFFYCLSSSTRILGHTWKTQIQIRDKIQIHPFPLRCECCRRKSALPVSTLLRICFCLVACGGEKANLAFSSITHYSQLRFAIALVLLLLRSTNSPFPFFFLVWLAPYFVSTTTTAPFCFSLIGPCACLVVKSGLLDAVGCHSLCRQQLFPSISYPLVSKSHHVALSIAPPPFFFSPASYIARPFSMAPFLLRPGQGTNASLLLLVVADCWAP